MSVARIGGVVDRRATTASLTSEVRGIARHLQLPAGSTTRVIADDGIALAWCGTGLADVHHDPAWMVLLDGAIYNRSDFDRSAPTMAAALARMIEASGFESAVRRLNGDFAVAAWDKRERVLYLARDRCGVRPLYHVTADGCTRFASTPGALLDVATVPGTPDRRFLARVAASHYRIFDNESAASPFEGVAQLPAAHLLRIAGRSARPTRYWCAPGEYHDAEAPVEAALAAQYRELLLDAVRIRLGDDQAFTLSGGMDSSSVLGSAVHLSGDRQQAWSTVYADATYDESQDIRTILEDTVSTWHRVPVEPGDTLERIASMIALHQEPVATATWLSHDVLCGQAAEAGVRILFGGLGGDELNAGEYEYFPYHFADLRAAGDASLEHEIAAWARLHDHPIHRKSSAVGRELMDRLTGPDGACRADPDRLGRYASLLGPGWLDGDVLVPDLDHPFTTCLRNRTWQDLARETLPCCLRAQDRQGVARGIEHRLPFIDHRLIELMFGVPGTMKIREGVTKVLLRRAMVGIVPETTRTRVVKTGWNAPAHVWFTGDGADALLDLVRSRSFRERGLYRPDACEALVREHEAIVGSGEARENHMMVLWQMANVELWLRWLDDRSAAADGDLVASRGGAG